MYKKTSNKNLSSPSVNINAGAHIWRVKPSKATMSRSAKIVVGYALLNTNNGMTSTKLINNDNESKTFPYKA